MPSACRDDAVSGCKSLLTCAIAIHVISHRSIGIDTNFDVVAVGAVGAGSVDVDAVGADGDGSDE